jgi:hypothetical protein
MNTKRVLNIEGNLSNSNLLFILRTYRDDGISVISTIKELGNVFDLIHDCFLNTQVIDNEL